MPKTKTLICLLFAGVAILAIFAISASDAYATVGGAKYIERLSYSQSENALYYLIRDEGGRGCMPEIGKINLTTNERSKVLTCDQIESQYRTRNGFDSSGYEQFIESRFKDLPVLQSVSLPKNNISAAVQYVGEKRYDEYNAVSNFRAVISQDGKEKAAIDFTGCYKDQPNVFRGYSIPNTKKMAVMISRIGDCFEGGYVNDDVYIVEGIEYRDTSPVGFNYSGPQVRQGNLIVSAQGAETSPVSSGKAANAFFLIVWIVAALAAGFGIGYAVKRRKAVTDQPL